jgi:hypothetical protein
MVLKAGAAFTAALIVVSLAVLPVDAATSKKRARQSQAATTTITTPPPPLLDRRVLGRVRTCGFDYMQYDGFGVPTGPYCH